LRRKTDAVAATLRFRLGHLVQRHAVVFQRREGNRLRTVDWHSATKILETFLGLKHQDLPKIRGVITSPTMRADGTLLIEDGYDAKTQLWRRSPPGFEMPAIAERPSKKDALEALALYDELLKEFAFADKVSRSVALAVILTLVLRAAFPHAPIFLIRAPDPRTGKSYFCWLAFTISLGWMPRPTAPHPRSEEMEKRI
jgi:hypothetical protein